MPTVTSPVMPAPIATIDSPSAMMMISPNRSAKCSGTRRQPPDQNRYGRPKSRTTARTQSPACTAPSNADAAASRATAIAVLPARPVTELRRSGSSGLAIQNSAMCAIRTTAYAAAKVRPR